MCLIVYNKQHEVANEDITAWKVVCTNGNAWIGPYMFDLTEFSFNDIVKPKGIEFDSITVCKDISGQVYYEINGGHFHSCVTKDECKTLLYYVSVSVGKAKRGIFGAKYKELAMKYNLLKICKCTIPKGTEFYTDGTYFATKQLIVHKS